MTVVELIWSPVGMLIVGIALGVIFDEFFTTKFSWVTFRGRAFLRDLKDKL